MRLFQEWIAKMSVEQQKGVGWNKIVAFRKSLGDPYVIEKKSPDSAVLRFSEVEHKVQILPN